MLRKWKKQDLTVQIGNMEDATEVMAVRIKDRLGAKFRPTTPKEAQDYRLNPHRGVAILWLASDGPLAKVGFEVGDIILQINSQNVDGLQDFVDFVRSFPPNSLITLLAPDHNTGQTGYVQFVIK